MEHIAVDLGGRESQICIRDGSGEILLERKVATDKLGFHLKQRPAGRVILETCSEAFAVADKLLDTRCVWCRRRWCERWGLARGEPRPTGATRRS